MFARVITERVFAGLSFIVRTGGSLGGELIERGGGIQLRLLDRSRNSGCLPAVQVRDLPCEHFRVHVVRVTGFPIFEVYQPKLSAASSLSCMLGCV